MATTLSESEVEHFVERGYVVVRGALAPDFVEEQVHRMWVRLGYDAHDRSSWAVERVHMAVRDQWEVAELAPRAWGAVCDLLGGQDRVMLPATWGDGFIVNLGVRADERWEGPSARSPGWHKDGDFFRHFLDSPEQGLLSLVLWTDVCSQGGATFLATDSVPAVARLLEKHPEGLLPEELPAHYAGLLEQCHEFVEATGRAGDVYLMHPYMLHATAPNVRRDGRAITNPPVALREPMCFDRVTESPYSPVERAVLRGLGVDRLPFRATGPRETAAPEGRRARHAEQARARSLEEERLRSAGLPLRVGRESTPRES